MHAAAVETDGLAKRFGETRALDGVSLRVDTGEVRGLLGRNGAGKTTLLRVLFGLLRPDAGSVLLFGRDPEPDGVLARADVAGFVEEPRFYPYLTARRNLELLGRLDGGSRRGQVDEVLDSVGLGGGRDQRVGTFSTGMRQRLGLAASLLRRPRLLLLDEPTIGLDPPGTRDVRQLIRALAADGVTVFLSSHDMSEVDEVCESVVIIHRGRVVWDGRLDRLREEARAHVHLLSTSDDRRALELGLVQPGVDVEWAPDRGLTVRADDPARDGYVLALGRAGIAVRRLEPELPPLEAHFAAVTGGEA
jgi:ABC-2 type transport system ATP-binding protein